MDDEDLDQSTQCLGIKSSNLHHLCFVSPKWINKLPPRFESVARAYSFITRSDPPTSSDPYHVIIYPGRYSSPLRLVSNVNLIGTSPGEVIVEVMEWQVGYGKNRSLLDRIENVSLRNLVINDHVIVTVNEKKAWLYSSYLFVTSCTLNNSIILEGRMADVMYMDRSTVVAGSIYQHDYRVVMSSCNVKLSSYSVVSSSSEDSLSVTSSVFFVSTLSAVGSGVVINGSEVSGSHHFMSGSVRLHDCLTSNWYLNLNHHAIGYIRNSNHDESRLSSDDGTGRIDRVVHHAIVMDTIATINLNPALITSKYQIRTNRPVGVIARSTDSITLTNSSEEDERVEVVLDPFVSS